MNKPIDVVYTWVDDQWPGYLDQLNQYAETEHDTNANRTRDNLDLIRYSLRSLELYVPWVRHIYIVSCRPQIPKWLDTKHPKIHIIHHDELIPNEILPTFNSFAIVSYVHKIKGLSENFIYIEDDIMFNKSVERDSFFDANGLIKFYPKFAKIRHSNAEISDRISPWNCAQTNINQLLKKTFKSKKSHLIYHMPLMFQKSVMAEMEIKFKEEFEQTRQSKFRHKHNIAPELLYPNYSIMTGKGRLEPKMKTYLISYYFGIENFLLLSYLALFKIKCHRTQFLALNDNFGDHPNPKVVKLFKKALNSMYPNASQFEKN